MKIKLAKSGLLVLCILAIIVAGCAKVGNIQGGPKDSIPPVVVKSSPKNFSTNFKGKKIKIEFNEFIELKDLNKEFNMSPPVTKKPKIWLNGKVMVVEIRDTLKDSTTYTLSFGNSIVDLNEGNKLSNFEFVISTGTYIDSMGVHGKIKDALTQKPLKEPLLAMLYANLDDSAFFLQKPMYTGSVDKDGNFAVNNVKPGKYNLFVLSDLNSNLKYDIGEMVAFCDSALVLSPEFITGKHKIEIEEDTARNDSVVMVVDSAKLRQARNSLHVNLISFIEEGRKQYIKSYTRPNRRCVNIVFNKPLIKDSLSIDLINNKGENWYLKDRTNFKDSLFLWIKDTTLIKTDTLRLGIGYYAFDKKDSLIYKKDTLLFRFIDTSNPKTKKPEEKANVLVNAPQIFELNGIITIECPYPVLKIDKEKLILEEKVDTVFNPVAYDLIQDSIFQRLFVVNNKWKEQTSYKMTILPGFANNIYGLPQDTIINSFTTKSLDSYGTLAINLTGPKMPVILQLLDGDKVKYEIKAETDGIIDFKYLEPKEYVLRLIEDKDNNGKYTSGNVLKKIQPENVIYYGQMIKIRANWDMEINWELK
ncbi:MAG TPA: Ig-like domain-containing domain [Bacteroidales bacterium]|nr:Ig-like domain-containing domain [Bacteroidales bacterium]